MFRGAALTGFMPVVAAAFSPLDLFAGGEKGAWFDASDLTTLFQDAAMTTPVAVTADPVGAWMDKSGNGNHVTQGTSTARPLYDVSGGLSSVLGDGVDDNLKKTSAGFTGYPITHFVVMKSDSASVEGGLVTVYNGYHYLSVLANGNVSGTRGINRNAAQQASTIEVVSGIKSIHYYTDADEVTVQVNNNTPLTAAVTNTWDQANLALFDANPVPFLPAAGRIYESITLSRALTTDELASLKAYAAAKWGTPT